MTRASDNVFPRFLISEGGSTATPAAGRVTVYAKADGLLYSKDDAGVETLVSGGSGSGSVATDAIWDAAGDLAVGTGANTAARLAIGAAGANLSQYNGAVAWNGGTSFPATPASGDRYWRSDLGSEFYYDGTRWLSTQVYHLVLVPVTNNAANPGNGTGYASPSLSGGSIYITKLIGESLVLTTNNGSNYWTHKVSYKTAPNTDNDLTGFTFNTSADTASTHTSHVITPTAVTATSSFLNFNWISSIGAGSPGNSYVYGILEYRRIAT